MDPAVVPRRGNWESLSDALPACESDVSGAFVIDL